MSLFFLTVIFAIFVWLTDSLLLWPIQVIDSFQLPYWLGLAIVGVIFTWLAAE